MDDAPYYEKRRWLKGGTAVFDLLIAGAQVIDVPGARAELIGIRDVAVEDGLIVAVASAGTIDLGQAREILDADEMVLMPGLVNAHAHAAMTLFRGAAEDLPFRTWFTERIRPLEANLTPEDVYWGTVLGIAEMFEAGVTSFADHYFQLDQVAAAVRDTGARALLAPVPIRRRAGSSGRTGGDTPVGR